MDHNEKMKEEAKRIMRVYFDAKAATKELSDSNFIAAINEIAEYWLDEKIKDIQEHGR